MTIPSPFRLVAAILALGTASLAAQAGPPAPPPEVAAAQAALNAGNPDSAIRALEALYRRSPNAIAGRLLLGHAWRQKGDADRALEAYLAVQQPRLIRFQARFHAAGIQARRGRAEAAFALLTELKQSGAFDMEQVRAAGEFEPLRTDPRFDSVMWRPADFENPFVEPVKVLHEWVAEAAGDQFSWIARGIGDVDGDGASEIVTSAPTWGANGQPTGPGRVYLYSGRSGGLLWTASGRPGEGLGTGLEAAGDVNRDGAGDVIAGAPGSDRAYVYSGKDGSVLLTLAADTTGERFGQAASSAGDQDGDGHADVLVGAPGSNAAGAGAGRAYLFSGKNGRRLRVLEGDSAGHAFGSIVAGVRNGRGTPLLVGAPGAGPGNRGAVFVFAAGGARRAFVINADTTGVALGAMFTSVVGDVNGDRVPDIYASDYTNAAKGPSTGRIYVHSGVDGRRLLTLTGDGPGDGFGVGSADVGDVNGDGHDDLVLGAWQYSAAAPSGGRIYLYSGKDGTVLRTITGRVSGETLGFDAAGVGDVDGDGVPDLLVTSSWSNIKGFRSGRMYLISGR